MRTLQIFGCYCLYFLLILPARAGIGKEVRDWSIWCDDILRCQMYIYTDSRELYSFGFERGLEANSETIPFLSIASSVSTSNSLKLKIDTDREFNLSFADSQLAEGVWRFPGNPQNADLLQAMMDGTWLNIELETESGSAEVPVSLAGVTGSALFIDEAQGRVGNQDALQARGEGEPADAKTRVSLLSSKSDLPVPIAEFWQDNTGDCDEGFEEGQDLVTDYGGIKISVEDNAALFVLPCGIPGAYNLPQIVLIHDTQTGFVRQLSFPVMGEKGPTLMDTPYNTNWDDRKSTLSAFFKGRGIGDCGFKNTWYWQGGYYSNFQLLEEYAKQDCDERQDNWPRLWPPE